MRRRPRLLAASVVLGLVIVAGAALLARDALLGRDGGSHPPPKPHRHQTARHQVPFGAFLGSGDDGVSKVAGFEAWAGAGPVTVGHTYLRGGSWSDIEGSDDILGPWSQWVKQKSGRILVLNVPMSDRNEDNLSDDQVRGILRQGAGGAFDAHYRALAQNLVSDGMNGAVIVLGWEMNGITYTGRCGPDPTAWKTYWRSIVATMRSVPGQKFRFDFDPSRGTDAISWEKCYPGDDVVDIIGMDSYDQEPGSTWRDYVDQPDGLEDQVDFAAKHGKPVSYPEWGLFRHGDDTAFVTDMLKWIATHNVAYQTITNYCPHGVYGSGDWGCGSNTQSAQAYRSGMRSAAG
ncbi:hypothetical protein BIV57_18645 [Mangrovactinospora gilvigrisea]|uniref:GH26 domain-containing protein n=1 Tax=Mangrovactinospora gilvigrisea TaxID=1428644 RepID=A0A1J7BBG3_9ACTN|nr:hypothetical protein BIV57_18645 [Mangrovactinospora gilvigrisea]